MIVKPADYRRILPAGNQQKRGVNKYVVRLYVDIPTEAESPVYDVNINCHMKLQNAATQQWYEAFLSQEAAWSGPLFYNRPECIKRLRV